MTTDAGRRATGIKTLARRLFPDVDSQVAERAFDALTDLILRSDGSIRLRAHLFARNIQGIWACSDASCISVPEPWRSEERRVGKLYSQPRYRCECGNRVLELLYCETCGGALPRRVPLRTRERSVRHSPCPHNSPPRALPERADLERNGASYTLYWPEPVRDPFFEPFTRTGGSPGDPDRPKYTYEFKPVQLEPRNGCLVLGAFDRTGFVYRVSSTPDPSMAGRVPAHPMVCPSCGDDRERYKSGAHARPVEDPGRSRSSIRTMGTGFEKANQVLSDALLRRLDRRKLVVFSDSRQDAAKLAAGLERSHHLDLVRQLTVGEADKVVAAREGDRVDRIDREDA